MGATVFIPYSRGEHKGNAIGVFNYPAGGEAASVLSGKLYKYVLAVTLSR